MSVSNFEIQEIMQNKLIDINLHYYIYVLCLIIIINYHIFRINV